MSETVEDQPELEVKKETKEVATRPEQLPMGQLPQTNQEMISWALVNDKLDAMERLIALKNAEEERAAKLEFDRHFAEMQKDYEPVKRASKGQFGVFADLNSILSVYGPILARHGFSISWEEEDVPGKEGWKRIVNLISGYGYVKRAKFDCPPAPAIEGGTKGANVIQLQGIQTSYGKRYSFNSNAGIILTDEDDDGATYDEGIKNSEAIRAIREVKSHAALKELYPTLIKNQDERTRMILNKEAGAKSKALRDAGITE